MIVSLELIREHIHADSDDVSNQLLTQYYNSAVGAIETYCHRSLVSDTDETAIASSEETVPAEVKQFLLVTIADLYEKGISVGSMSKVFAVAGLRLGWIATRDRSVRILLILQR